MNAFEQKHLSTRLQFAFEDDVLRLNVEDASHQHEFTVPYAEIPFETTRFTEKMEALRGGAIFFAVLGVLGLLASIADPSRLIHSGVMAALACLAWLGYKRLRGTYTIYDTNRGRLMVLGRGEHDAIIAEIESRRRTQLREHFAQVNLENDPQHETRKFDWLRRNGVISDNEYEQRVSEIEGRPTLAGPDAPKTVH